MLDVAEGLTYLHQQDPPIIHRDLASKNVLLTKKRQAKIADVGVAKMLSEGEQMYCSPVPGTPVYAAPETFVPGYDPRFAMLGGCRVEYDTKIDIFSFGITLMEVINGKLPSPQPCVPFASDGRQIPERERRKRDIGMMGEHKLKEIVFKCIEDSSERRPGAEELIELFQCESAKIKQKEHIAKGGKTPKIDVVLLGGSGVGKSSLILRYCEHSFFDKIVPTVGLEFAISTIRLHDREFTLKISDTAGQEKCQSIVPQLIRNVQGIVIVYDVTNRSSFIKGVPRMHKFIKKYAPDNVSLTLVGNKAEEA
ncbi:LRR receptor-like serine/threonine-protein kinase FEI 1 [Stylophora pistillata]|uniref:GTP-binding protein YPTM2 n=1 Tax=Stylophora pistillata TaxID=50429 RepID=A0A2B4RRG4_STYPI|nr:LRR receptor-like serine/threonine-protein kinase FEI 1 [Stylophora pistillata]PFX20191.1 GTP-binding protein YPTM2 [Stylophora pistillata]